jgi:integrase
MIRHQQRISVFKRKRTNSKKSVYYVKIITVEGEKRVSTGQTNKTAALNWTYEYLRELEDFENQEAERMRSITVRDLSRGFWDEDGNYAAGKRARLRTISHGYLDICRSVTKNYIVPRWGRFRLVDLTPTMIDRWVIELIQKPQLRLHGKKNDSKKKEYINLAPGTVNKILQILKVMLEQACAEGYIQHNPSKHIKPISDRNYKRKGVLTSDEVKALLNPDIWDDYRHYAINLLSLSTGIRISEVRGLLVEQIHPDHIQVHTAWEEQHGLKEPKWGSIRDIPITPKVYGVLMNVIEKYRPQTIVFYGKSNLETPMSKSVIEKHLYKAMKKLGIDKETRKQRHLTFHSHRHTLNTMLRSAGVHDAKVRAITGHRQESMTERYTHFGVQDFTEVTEIQSSFI